MESNGVSLLMRLGLTEAEARVYLRLLREGSVTAGRLARITGYSRTKVYEILEKLRREGLAESYPTRPAKFKALDPSASIPMLIERRKRELAAAEEVLLSSLSKIWNKRSSQEGQVFITEGIHKASAKLLEILNTAEEKIYSFMAWVYREEYGSLLSALREAHDRGVEIFMVVYDNPHFNDGAAPEELSRFSSFCRRFCLLPRDFHPFPLPPLKILLVDDRDVNIVFGDYFETGSLRDAISVHYHNIPGIGAVARCIAPVYFENFFSKFGRG